MAGKAGDIVDQICESSSNSSLSDYSSDNEISSQSSVTSAVPYSSGSTNESRALTRSETVEGSSKNSTTSRYSRSLLSVLQRATSSDLCRKRSIRHNLPKGKKRRVSSLSCSNPKSVTPAQRCLEFRDEPFTVSAGKLFCNSCREELSLKRSIIKNHVSSSKRKSSKVTRANKQINDRTIVESLKLYEADVHPRGEKLPEAQRLYRVKVVTALLKAGIPLSKIEPLREILEEHAYRLSDVRGMFDLIPFVHSQVQQEIKAELSEKYVSVIFNGTTRLGEAFAVVLRFVSDKQIKQRLIKFQILNKSLTGEEIAREVISILQVSYGICAKKLLACMHDRASVNGAAMRTIKIIFSHVVDVGCYSHTIDLIGEKFDTPLLDEFIRLWISLFAHSFLARIEWKTKTGISMKLYSATRWWSK